MNKYKYNPIKMTPFKWFVLENFPFIEEDFDAITSYQLWCKLKQYFDKVSTKTNELGNEVEKLSGAFIVLKNYVDNYFKNLDVQDEINNKLDEMAEDGTLQQIITAFLQLDSLLCFDTVNEMCNSTNLINGSHAITFGYHSRNDGGMAKYKIRTKLDDETTNTYSLLQINNSNLVAELVIENNTINPNMFGAYGDGEHDDTNALNNCFLYAYLNKLNVHLLSSIYNVSNTINIYSSSSSAYEGINIYGNTRGNPVFNAITQIDNLINITPYGESTVVSHLFLSNLCIKGNNLINNAIYISGSGLTNSKFENIRITNCLNSGITNKISLANVYLNSFIKIRCNYCETGIELANGINTSNRFVDCYMYGCESGYKLKGTYSVVENCCGDAITDTVFYFTEFVGTVISPGAESPKALYVFYFIRSSVTVINPWTYGNMENAEAIHVRLTTNSKVTFINGKILLNPLTSTTDGIAEGKLYQLALDCNISFDGTVYSSFKLKNTYTELTNCNTTNNNYGLVSQRYGDLIAFIGRDTRTTDGLLDNKNIESQIVANAIFFGLGDEIRYGIDGTDYRWKSHNSKGDILLSRNPKNIGGIGWIQDKDFTQETQQSYWTSGDYLKIPVILSGTTENRPTVSLVVGQMYFDTTLHKPIWYKGSSKWVDATGTEV